MRCEPVEVTSARARPLACSICGCTEANACPGGCWWIWLDPPICSACESSAAAALSAEPPVQSGFFGNQLCPASRVPAIHAPLWIDETSGYCARCHEGFVC